MANHAPDCSLAFAAAHKLISAVRAKDDSQLNNWMDQSGATLGDFTEVSFSLGSDEGPFNDKGGVFHPETLRSILDAVKMPVFDVVINTDLLYINGPMCGIYPTALQPGSSEEYLSALLGERPC